MGVLYIRNRLQIGHDLGGFTLGRSDLSDVLCLKKIDVMQEERKNFVYET